MKGEGALVSVLVNCFRRGTLLDLVGGTSGLLTWGEIGLGVVNRPTQLFYIWIFICKYTNLKDTAGQSARVIVPRYIFTWMHKKEDLVAAEWEEEGSYKTTPCCLYECHSDPEKKKKRGSRRTNGRKDALCCL